MYLRPIIFVYGLLEAYHNREVRMKKYLMLIALCTVFLSTGCHAHRGILHHPPVVQKPVVVQKPTVVHKPATVHKTTVVHKPVAAHKPVVVHNPKKEQKTVVIHQTTVVKPQSHTPAPHDHGRHGDSIGR